MMSLMTHQDVGVSWGYCPQPITFWTWIWLELQTGVKSVKKPTDMEDRIKSGS